MQDRATLAQRDDAATSQMAEAIQGGRYLDLGFGPGQTAARRSAMQNAATRVREAVQSLGAGLRGLPAWVLVIQLFIGAGWLRAAVEKIIDPQWWNGTAVEAFVAEHAALTLPWYRSFLDTVVRPNLLLMALVLVLAQLFVGAALLTGRKVGAALVVGLFLNLNFVAAGAVNPSIFYLVCQAALLLWMVQYRAPGGIAARAPRWLPAASLVLFVLNVPFIASLDPAAVIEDPATILAFLGAVLVIASRLGTAEVSFEP